MPVQHAADQNGDSVINLSELLRVIQFYNLPGYHCAATPDATEDGYVPGVDELAQECTPHSSDYQILDWKISLSELLRTIQFYNVAGFTPCEGGEDGFCPVFD